MNAFLSSDDYVWMCVYLHDVMGPRFAARLSSQQNHFHVIDLRNIIGITVTDYCDLFYLIDFIRVFLY